MDSDDSRVSLLALLLTTVITLTARENCGPTFARGRPKAHGGGVPTDAEAVRDRKLRIEELAALCGNSIGKD